MKQGREEGLKVEELPAVVIKRAGADFSVYILIIILTKMSEECKRSLLLTILVPTTAYSIICYWETKDGSLAATYNGNGKFAL
jgi:hypothetical protein